MDMTLPMVALGGIIWLGFGLFEIAFKVWLHFHHKLTGEHCLPLMERYNDD